MSHILILAFCTCFFICSSFFSCLCSLFTLLSSFLILCFRYLGLTSAFFVSCSVCLPPCVSVWDFMCYFLPHVYRIAGMWISISKRTKPFDVCSWSAITTHNEEACGSTPRVSKKRRHPHLFFIPQKEWHTFDVNDPVETQSNPELVRTWSRETVQHLQRLPLLERIDMQEQQVTNNVAGRKRRQRQESRRSKK